MRRSSTPPANWQQLPLAMGDASTHHLDDMQRMKLKCRERTGGTHDSETDCRARFMGHTAFEDPTTPPDAQRRDGIEVRTMAFF